MSRSAAPHQRRPRDLRSFWRRSLAVLAPVPMLAIAAEQALAPYGLFATPAEQLRAGATSLGRVDAALWAGLVGALLCLPATMAVAWAARRSAPRLALGGGLVTLVALAVSFSMPSAAQLVRVAAETGLDGAAVARAIDLVGAHGSTGLAVGIFLVGQAVGLLLLGLALWRTPRAPRWAAALLAVSGVAHVALSANQLTAAGSWVLTAIGYGAASAVLLRTRDRDFDLPPAGTGAEADSPAPVTGPDVRRTWRLLLGVTAPVAAIFIAVLRFLLPFSTPDDARSAFLAIVDSPGFNRWQIWAGLVVLPMIVSGVLAVVWVTRRRVPMLTTVAGVLCVLGYTALVAGGSPGSVLALLVSDGQLDLETGYQLASRVDTLPATAAAVLIFVLGHLLGTLLLGIALWRSRAVPAWVGIALAVSQPAHLIAAITGNHPLDLLAWGTTAFGFGAAGLVLLRMGDDAFDLPPAAEPSPARMTSRTRMSAPAVE